MKARDQVHVNTTMVFGSMLAWLAIAMSSSGALAQEPRFPLRTDRPDARQPARAGALRTFPVPFRLEQPHQVAIAGIQLPGDTRVTSIFAGQVDVKAAGRPNDRLVRLVPGLVTYQRLRLSGALPVTGDHFQWFQDMRQGPADRREGVLTILARDLQPIQEFRFFESMPVGFEIDIPHAQWHLIIAFERFELFEL